jgi:hypothetical protein
VVQLRVKASAKAVFWESNSSPPILTHCGSNLPAIVINPENNMTNAKNIMHITPKRKMKLTLNIQCKYSASFWLGLIPTAVPALRRELPIKPPHEATNPHMVFF